MAFIAIEINARRFVLRQPVIPLSDFDLAALDEARKRGLLGASFRRLGRFIDVDRGSRAAA
jgi:hypothetical protein